MVDFIKELIQLGTFLIFLTFLLIFIGVKVKKNLVKHICFNAAAVVFCLLIYEVIILRERQVVKKTLGNYSGYFYVDENFILGYGTPREDRVITSTRLINGDTIYDVKYTIKDKIRSTPNSNKQSNDYRIFLGCSQTFGEGLNDNETLPYYYNEISNRNFNIRNYGFHGYGSHQALAIVENILSNDSILLSNSKNVIVFYNFYNFHIERAAGYASWDNIGPRYEVENGVLIYKGSLATKYPKTSQNIITKVVERIWERSNIYKNHFLVKHTVITNDVQRTLLIIKKMNDLLSKRGIRFIFIIDKKTKEDKTFINFLLSNNIEITCLECNIPDFGDNEEYVIKGDGHASKIFNKLKANILTQIVE